VTQSKADDKSRETRIEGRDFGDLKRLSAMNKVAVSVEWFGRYAD
jgi:hypothetical protein